MNDKIFDAFIELTNKSDVLEIGLKGKYINRLKSACIMHSFDISSSALKFNRDSLFKQNALVRLPYKDDMFAGTISYKSIGYGDSKFLFNEICRVTTGTILICENDVSSLPIDYLMTLDNMNVDYVSTDGEIIEMNSSFVDFFSRRDLRRIFYKPGGSLNKFNLLVPEDITEDICILCSKK